MYSTSEAKLKADDAHMKVESNSVSTAIRLYKEDNGGKVPHSVSYTGQMLNENDTDPSRKAAYQEVMQKLVTGGYLPEIPTSPSGSGYSYMVSDDGTKAVFAAALNITTSGGGGRSNKNSCDFIVLDSSYGSCSIEIGPLNCSDITYNNQTHKCFDVESYKWGGVCRINSVNGCEGYSTSPSVPDEACSWITDPNAPFFCPENETHDNKTAVCEIDNSVCSGSSNSDYCSCI